MNLLFTNFFNVQELHPAFIIYCIEGDLRKYFATSSGEP